MGCGVCGGGAGSEPGGCLTTLPLWGARDKKLSKLRKDLAALQEQRVRAEGCGVQAKCVIGVLCCAGGGLCLMCHAMLRPAMLCFVDSGTWDLHRIFHPGHLGLLALVWRASSVCY
jgi:hypothetical protein